MASIRNWKGEKRVLEDSFDRIYTKFKLHFYQAVFSRFQTREASLTAVETFCMEIIRALDTRAVRGAALSVKWNLSNSFLPLWGRNSGSSSTSGAARKRPTRS